MNSHKIIPENYEKDFVLQLAKSGSLILDGMLGFDKTYFGKENVVHNFNKLEQKLHLLHMCIGMSGEMFELIEAIEIKDVANIREEVGDILFYLVGMHGLIAQFDSKPWYDSASCELSDFNTSGHVISESKLTFAISELQDQIKKFIIYNDSSKFINLINYWNEAFECLIRFSIEHFENLQDIIDENVIKLSKRYEGLKYSDNAAKNRADKIDPTLQTMLDDMQGKIEG